MSERRALLDTAAFLDSAESLRVSGASTEQLRTIVQRFLSACYEDVGKAPKHLDGADLQTLLCEHLPRRFAARDPLGAVAEEVLAAYFAYLHGREVVFAAYEQRTAFDQHIDTFRAAVASGTAHADGRLVGKGKTIETRGDKVGRNDPCPCGSGKKFKKCCARLGDD